MATKTSCITDKIITVAQALDLAIDYFQKGDIEKTKEICTKILLIDKNNSDCYNLLGIIEAQKGRHHNAIELFNSAISIKSDFSYLYNLGNSYKAVGSLDQAINSYRLAIDMQPSYAGLYFQLGMALRDQGNYKASVEVFRNWVRSNPSDADGLINLGSILAEQNEYDEAIDCYQKVLRLDPTSKTALFNQAVTLANQSRIGEASKIFDKLLAEHPSDAFKIISVLQIPIIPSSTQAILDWREEFLSKINQLIEAELKIQDPLSEIGKTSFYLAFHGLDNRELNCKIAQLMMTSCPSLSWTSPHCLENRQSKGRIRIGFISKFFHLHSIGKTSRGLIAELSRKLFEVHSIFVPPVIDDPVSRLIQNCSDYYHILPQSLHEARKEISNLKLDILFYQDIGMEPFTYYLAFSRLARVQCVSFGHPDTTGIDNIDYFISTNYFEPRNSGSCYSEKLIELQNVATPAYYYEPETRLDKTRHDFGLSERTNLYLCPQTLFKFHPDFDFMLAQILRIDDQATILCLEAHIPYWTKLLKERFKRSVGEAVKRILFLSRQNFNDYMNLLAFSDVVLDTLYFNGMNTTLEAFSVGTPVITLPSHFQRGRHTFGMYQKMGIYECIATDPSDYARRAAQIANDKDLRNSISRKIIDRKTVLFEDRQVLSQWEEFLVGALNLSLKRSLMDNKNGTNALFL
jgi:protein O-GlcNAc transferase